VVVVLCVVGALIPARREINTIGRVIATLCAELGASHLMELVLCLHSTESALRVIAPTLSTTRLNRSRMAFSCDIAHVKSPNMIGPPTCLPPSKSSRADQASRIFP
jgi:hypothetical protein